jgi:hypothetical protein
VSFDRIDNALKTDRTTTVAVNLKPAYYLPIADGLFVHAGVPLAAIVGGEARAVTKATGDVAGGGITGWSAGLGGGLAYALGDERGAVARLNIDYAYRSLTYAPDFGTGTRVAQGVLSAALGFGAHF